jgi:hypothetical protein
MAPAIRRSLLRWPSSGESDPADPPPFRQHCARPEPAPATRSPFVHSSRLGVNPQDSSVSRIAAAAFTWASEPFKTLARRGLIDSEVCATVSIKY